MYNKAQKNTDDFIFGIRAVIEAIDSSKEIDKILLKKGSGGDLFKELFEKIREHQIPFQYVPQEKINRITRKNHQGVLAFISPVTFYELENFLPSVFEAGKNPLILVLDQVTDVRNFGAIVRTAECAGVDAIVIPEKGAARINADAVKTSAGALHLVPVCRTKDLKKSIVFLKESGLRITAATEKSSNNYTQADFTGPTAIVMGSEEKGIEQQILNLADAQLQIPILGKIESLNVSVAAGLLVYEAVRQRLTQS
ncbi:23S rRNA (guanosine(2251)-2'-O)-methyltransferase RlmB [uncultured Sunxiuqinia sp.]|uniref:23S rRNA (guanosine(2251)-2'-O)-methyltransferase RlmB n=1 Tax=uncultured Sunxiuqinia sp. TaxID=1573825 RepID=UPI001987AC2E|nr:23S rRNA (guanosine(2251)-2'-O)-methyltransferase RlmB [Sunxiuqinia sp.]|tara:strand:- start:23990 stop:24751 length:762 start_codon:yes stop_codon:yes gene_type:complete